MAGEEQDHAWVETQGGPGVGAGGALVRLLRREVVADAAGVLRVERQNDEPSQSHAWIELYSPTHGWVPSDPTHDREIDDAVRVAFCEQPVSAATTRPVAVAPIASAFIATPFEWLDDVA